jgi:hypothetical protein
MILSKPGVQFSRIASAGVRILAALDSASALLGCDLTITSACDGAHSGPDDPHHLGEAFDVRTHDLGVNDKLRLVRILSELLPTDQFFMFIEAPSSPNEHMHIQRKKGTVYAAVRPDLGRAEGAD